MASGYKNAAGTDFDDLFDPDVIGDGPTATNFKKADGSLLKYAAAKYGTVGPNVNYKLANNTDLATLWSKKGTAKYTTPDNGTTYNSVVNIGTGQSLSSKITVTITPTQYIVTVYNKSLSGAMTPTEYTYDIPAGMTQFYLKITYSSGASGLLSITDHESWSALPAASTIYGIVTSGPRGSSSGTTVTTCNCYLAFGTASAAVFSGNTTLHLETDGSS